MSATVTPLNLGNNENVTDEDEDDCCIKLMRHETDVMSIMPAVTTMTRYRISEGSNSPEKNLRSNLKEILRQNPWLAGRLVKSAADECVCLRFQRFIMSVDLDRIVDDHFAVVEEVVKETSYDELVQRLDPFQVKKGSDCINKREKLFKVTLLKVKERNEIVLLWSVCHSIADGYTFYKLHNMLDRNTPVSAMEPLRHTDVEQELVSLLGRQAVDWFNNPLIMDGIRECTQQQEPMKVHIVEVDQVWIDKQKAVHRGDNSGSNGGGSAETAFISTNDVITAWHNRTSRCDISLMTVNCRNRVPSFTDSMAGNYQNSIMYNEASDGNTALAIRQSLFSFRNSSDSVPSSAKTLSWNCNLVTNWSTFFQAVDISDPESDCHCEYLLHCPIVAAAELTSFRESACIFRLDSQRLAMQIATRFLTPEMLEAEGVGGIVCFL